MLRTQAHMRVFGARTQMSSNKWVPNGCRTRESFWGKGVNELQQMGFNPINEFQQMSLIPIFNHGCQTRPSEKTSACKTIGPVFSTLKKSGRAKSIRGVFWVCGMVWPCLAGEELGTFPIGPVEFTKGSLSKENLPSQLSGKEALKA